MSFGSERVYHDNQKLILVVCQTLGFQVRLVFLCLVDIPVCLSLSPFKQMWRSIFRSADRYNNYYYRCWFITFGLLFQFCLSACSFFKRIVFIHGIYVCVNFSLSAYICLQRCIVVSVPTIPCFSVYRFSFFTICLTMLYIGLLIHLEYFVFTKICLPIYSEAKPVGFRVGLDEFLWWRRNPYLAWRSCLGIAPEKRQNVFIVHFVWQKRTLLCMYGSAVDESWRCPSLSVL